MAGPVSRVQACTRTRGGGLLRGSVRQAPGRAAEAHTVLSAATARKDFRPGW